MIVITRFLYLTYLTTLFAAYDALRRSLASMLSRVKYQGLGIMAAGACTLIPMPSYAAECWQVIGWDSTAYVGAQALLQEADCTTVPEDYGWIRVNLDYGTPPADDLYLRVHNDDPRVSGDYVFEPLLFFAGYDGGGTPEVFTELIPCVGCVNEMDLSPIPPEQGLPNAGARVRLRHAQTGPCAYSQAINGAQARNRPCWFDADLTYVLEDAGGGYYRLRHENSNQCLYSAGGDGAYLHNWQCWNDPNMEFALDPAADGYRLRHRLSSQCAFGTSAYGGYVHHWGCWADPNMKYFVDIIDYGGWTAWLNRDSPGGTGDWEHRTGHIGVCSSPQDIQCRTTGGLNWTLTGEVVTCTPDYGLQCVNAQQTDNYCENYEVRFLCP